MSIKEDALTYLRSFQRELGSPFEEGFYERRAEAMRRAHSVGVTYAAIGRAVGVSTARARQVVINALREGQMVPWDWRCYASEKGAIRAIVERNDSYTNPGQDVTRRP